MNTRREFIALGAGAAVAALPHTAGAFELPDDPTPEEVDGLRRKWSFWLDPPEGYSFRHESRLVRRYEYSEYDAELYLQRNGPEEWHWQRVLKVFPKAVGKPLATVAIPYYYIEGTLGHELDDEGKVLERSVPVAQAVHLVKRGFAAITCDASHENYVRYEPGKAPDRANAADRMRDMAVRLAEDWPMWNPHAHRVFCARLMLDLLEGDPRVDPARIGMTGHSLGGQTGFYAGCLDPRVKAIMVSDFGVDFDQTAWQMFHYWGGRLAEVRAEGLENHTLLTLSGAKPVCILGGHFDDDTSMAEMMRAKGYRGRPGDLLLINHATGHRPPPWAFEAGYNFLYRKLNGIWGRKPWTTGVQG